MTYTSPSSLNMSKGFLELINYLNYVTDYVFAYMLMISVYVIFLVGYYKAKNDFGGALAIAGFVTFVVGLLFWLGGWIPNSAMAVTLAVGIIGVVVILFDKGNT
jgi:CHASE2 domain-containing sensor protein